MQFYNYFFEIKSRFFLLVLTWISTISVVYSYKETLLFMFIRSSIAFFENRFFYFIFTDITEIFSLFIEFIFFFNNQIFIPFFFYHFFVFFIPALRFFEYKFLNLALRLFIMTFIFSFIICHFFVFPVSWQFFFSFQEQLYSGGFVNLYFEAKLKECLRFYISVYYLVLVYFQIFTFLFFCFKFTSKRLLFMKKFRRIIYFSFFVLATLGTPPDIVSQIIFSAICILFYELFIIYFIMIEIRVNKF